MEGLGDILHSPAHKQKPRSREDERCKPKAKLVTSELLSQLDLPLPLQKGSVALACQACDEAGGSSARTRCGKLRLNGFDDSVFRGRAKSLDH